MKQTFGEYIKWNPMFIGVILGFILLWVAVANNVDQLWLWALAIVVTLVAIVGLVRNLNGKDGV